VSVAADALVREAPLPVGRRCAVIAAGKAAWGMAHALVDRGALDLDRGIGAGPRGPSRGLPAGFEWYAGQHPLPGDASERGGRRALDVARAAGADDVPLVVLLSGGASATMAVPAEGITLAEKSTTTGALLRAGVAIHELNCVRKHLSAIKGGRLAIVGRNTLTLAISDVHGPIEDDPGTIGSGPTAADPTTYGEALGVIVHAGVRGEIPANVLRHLERGAAGALEETPKPGDPRLAGSDFRVIANRHTAMRGAAGAAESRGYVTHVLPNATSGEAREAGEAFARAALAFADSCPRACCVVASGETTVHVRGAGRGGRNQEFALGAAGTLARWSRTSGRAARLASAGTDGVDGPTDAAGAIVDPTTLTRAHAVGVDPAQALSQNATYDFFRTLDDLIVWGPTGTNVGDVHVALIA
jgi:glycerate-2-kinase